MQGPERGYHAMCSSEADARLIAAAPDLLEAVWAAREFMWVGVPGSPAERQGLLDQIDAAIAKAEATP